MQDRNKGKSNDTQRESDLFYQNLCECLQVVTDVVFADLHCEAGNDRSQSGDVV